VTGPISLAEDTVFRAQQVLPGTPYPDEPSEYIPAGWYVVGSSGQEGAEVIILVDEAWDADGEEIRERIAKSVAAHLNETFGDPS